MNLTYPVFSKFLSPVSLSQESRSRVSINSSAEAAMSSLSSPIISGEKDSGEKDSGDLLVQYIVLRRDLIDVWPLGSIVTQGCHAAIAAISSFRDRIDTAEYVSTSNIDSMTKVTLEVKGEAQIRNLSEKLTVEGIEHKLWIEQPENIPTCLATRPYLKSSIASYFKKLKLCK